MKLLLDMNLSPKWARTLADKGFETTHWISIGAATASDPEIMAYARAHGYAVLTQDLDFSAILAVTQGKKPSVIQIRADDLNPNVIGDQVIAALVKSEPELERGALVTIDPKRTRVRLLPLSIED